MNVGLKYGFSDDAAAHSVPMTEEMRRIWHHPGQHVSMIAFLLDGMFDEELDEAGDWYSEEWD